MATTKHTCGGPAFGRKTPGCPRCDELLAGAEPVRWNTQATRDREIAEARWQAEHAAAERAQVAALSQLPTCCANHYRSMTISMGRITDLSVRGCPRHGDVNVRITPVPSLLYPTAAPRTIAAEDLH